MEEEQSELSNEEVDPSKFGGVEGITVDLEKYDKKSVKIESAVITRVPSTYTTKIKDDDIPEDKWKYHDQWVLKVSSEPVETIETVKGGEKKSIEFRASELFNLVQSDEGKLEGFPTGEGSNIMKLLKDLKCKEPEKLESIQKIIDFLIGETVVIKSYEKESSGSKRTYLKFRY